MKVPVGLLKWLASTAQNTGVGLGILGLGTLIFRQETYNQNPEFWGATFVVTSFTLMIVSGLIEVWIVVRDKGK